MIRCAAILCSLALCSAAVLGDTAVAQPAQPVQHEARLVPEGGNTHGRIGINLAAGNDNQQLGSAVIAIGANATGHGFIRQSQSAPWPDDKTTHAVIDGSALAGASGMISVNVTAGSQNQSANLAVIALGLEGLAASDALLAQTRASHEPRSGPEPAASPNDRATMSPDAFRGVSGLVQVNLIGGERNSSGNTFALIVSAQGSQ